MHLKSIALVYNYYVAMYNTYVVDYLILCLQITPAASCTIMGQFKYCACELWSFRWLKASVIIMLMHKTIRNIKMGAYM